MIFKIALSAFGPIGFLIDTSDLVLEPGTLMGFNSSLSYSSVKLLWLKTTESKAAPSLMPLAIKVLRAACRPESILQFTKVSVLSLRLLRISFVRILRFSHSRRKA